MFANNGSVYAVWHCGYSFWEGDRNRGRKPLMRAIFTRSCYQKHQFKPFYIIYCDQKLSHGNSNLNKLHEFSSDIRLIWFNAISRAKIVFSLEFPKYANGRVNICGGRDVFMYARAPCSLWRKWKLFFEIVVDRFAHYIFRPQNNCLTLLFGQHTEHNYCTMSKHFDGFFFSLFWWMWSVCIFEWLSTLKGRKNVQ